MREGKFRWAVMKNFLAKFFSLYLIILLYSCSSDKAEEKSSPKGDPLYPYLWHLKNTGQKVFSVEGGTPGMDINVEKVWEMGITGKGVRIVVSDRGLDIRHEDFQGQLLDGEHRNYGNPELAPTFIGDPTPSEDDNDGDHGTSVAGFIAMAAHNGIGGRGVAYGAKVAGFGGTIGGGDAVLLDQAQGDFDIFNYSFGKASCEFRSRGDAYIAQLKHGVENLRDGKGALYIKGAGNDFNHFPRAFCDVNLDEDDPTLYVGNASIADEHAYPWVVVVGATNAKGTRAAYSIPGSALWVVAPGGEEIAPGGENTVQSPATTTTDLSGCDRGYHRSDDDHQFAPFMFGGNAKTLDPECNYMSLLAGTSFATPIVAGVVALMLEANPELTWRDVRHILATTSRKVDGDRSSISHPQDMDLAGHTYQQTWVTNAADYSFHNWYGFGMVDALAAVKAAQNHSTLGSLVESAWVDSSTTLNKAIPDNSATGMSHSLNVTGTWTVESVQIKVTLTHPAIGNLGLELSSPSGTKSIIIPINSRREHSNMVDVPLLSNAFYGESATGNWTIKVIDPATGETGTLNKWSIKIFGRSSQ